MRMHLLCAHYNWPGLWPGLGDELPELRPLASPKLDKSGSVLVEANGDCDLLEESDLWCFLLLCFFFSNDSLLKPSISIGCG